MGIAERILSQHTHSERPPVRDTPFAGPIVWGRDSLGPEDGVIRLDPASRRELDRIVEVLRHNPLPTQLLVPDEFEMPACRAMMARAKKMLDEGVGFVIIDRLPLEEYSVDEARAAYWLLAQLVSRPVAQSWDGKVIYDVRDFGRPPGNGVRPDITNAEQNFHTDNSYNLCPPDYVALLCLRPAMEGGISSVVSFYAVYNEMLKSHRRLVERLFRPYLFDRQREHAPDEPKVLSHPLLEYQRERLVCRLSHRQVVNGYRLAGEELDAPGLEALETLERTMMEPRFAREFFFEPGQIQIVDNIRCGHRRTGFKDYPEESRKRHLIRLWLRDKGRRFYNG
jgi:alpha-ketoglutarate-dependent taurine dioxygenase